MSNNRLIIFAKAPVPGRVKTRLCPPLTHEEAAAMHAAFIKDTLGMAAGSAEWSVSLAYTPQGSEALFRKIAGPDVQGLVPQRGADLGLKMLGSLERALSSGATKAALIGTDIPTLTPGLISDAFGMLDNSDLVLGPSEDGGYYLVALKRPERALFEAMDWSTHEVLDNTLKRAAALGMKSSLLPAQRDVDTPDDLAALLDTPLPPETKKLIELLRPRLARR